MNHAITPSGEAQPEPSPPATKPHPDEFDEPRPDAQRPLDALNLFLADVRDGLGPYLAIYLLTVQRWDEARIGVVMAAGMIAGIVAQTPAGALIDRSHAKIALIIAAAVAVTISSLMLPLWPDFSWVLASQIIAGAAGSIFAPAIAAITLGIVGTRAFARRTGRNEAFNHAGNALSALIAGVLAWSFGPIVVFWMMAVMAVGSIVAALRIPAGAIDHDRARGLAEPDATAGQAHPSGWRSVLANRPLRLFALSVVVFHFSNAAMLPLVGQKLALLAPQLGTSLMSICIVAAQLVMVPVALFVGARADRIGHKRIFLVAFAVLACRGALYVLSDNPYWLVAVQLLDGIGAGIYGALFPLVVAALTRGSGRFNVSQGAITTALAVGAALSTAISGFIVVSAGYTTAFLFLAAVAAVGFVLYGWGMPETATVEAVERTG